MIATSASVCGIIVLAFPISMIVEKFASAQQRAIEREAAKQGKHQLLFLHNCVAEPINKKFT